jgi:fimbrial isopeptide formation D2 family protein/uncharacterized repeat protein (TIGR01451 family)
MTRTPRSTSHARWLRASSLVARRLYALIVVALLVSVAASSASAQVCANPGQDGVGTLSGVVNTYFPGAASASAGATSITLGTMRAGGAATPIAVGDLLLVIQMQDGTFNSSNNTTTVVYGAGTSAGRGLTSTGGAGLYEYVVATSASSGNGAVTIKGANGNGLVNAYTNAAANAIAGAGAQGVRRFQVVRVPQYSSASLSGTVTAPMWDGSSGGVVAFDVAGNLNLNSGIINVTGLGFRGGGGRPLVGGKAVAGGGNPSPTNSDYAYLSSSPASATNGAHGSKGEGIVGTPRYTFNPTTNTVDELSPTAEGYPNGSYARGAPGNAGGGGTDSDATGVNQNNSGGGGGANGGDGGHGGNTWSDNLTLGGLGGVSLVNLGAGRIVMGGGGGAGSRNNSVNYDSSGASGGGIVLLRVNSVSGSGTINADGNAAWNNTANDGGGGGGAGGSVVVVTTSPNSLAGLSINARGGRGGDAWRVGGTSNADRHGPGGGGGGGFVAQTGGALAIVSGGAHGITTSLADAYNSTDGAGGQSLVITQSQIPGASSGAQCVPVLTTTKTTSTASVNNSSVGTTATYTITVAAAANRATATSVSLSDALPVGFTYSSTGAVTLSGGATRPSTTNPASGATNPAWTSFTIPAGGQVQLTFTVAVASSVARGTYQNPATATYLDPRRTVANGTTTSSYDPASSTGEDVTVLSPPTLSMQKRCTSPANCETAGQQPNTDLTYTITFTNTGDQTARSITIVDIIPFSVNVATSSIIRSTEFKVGSLSLTPGASGLTLPASGMKYYNDAITYPANPPWTPSSAYTPPGAAGTYDSTVTYVAWQLTGTLAPGASASVSFTVRIK